MRVICDSSALIALEQIKKLGLLALFDSILIAPAVVDEVEASVPVLEMPALSKWVSIVVQGQSIVAEISTQPLTQALGAQILRASLRAGESETIALALETDTPVVILDDLAARRLAIRLGLRPLGRRVGSPSDLGYVLSERLGFCCWPKSGVPFPL